ncbi:thioredoxin family protein [Aquimarina agarilytica]|uniref:thioredoxin family protein n=1 Tax=Aquimarina agarilytica TaxID=1087449 RepID=UPI00028817A1|nr:thioredoxin family protein [Aquimarina agarilytica]
MKQIKIIFRIQNALAIDKFLNLFVMKRISCIVTLLTFIFVFSSYTLVKSKKGIEFFKGTWLEALEKAEQDKKFIFLDIYADWCSPCKKLKRISFKNEAVGEYYNENYVNIAVDGETKEGRALIDKYSVRSYPTLLIIDYHGNLRTKVVGFKKPQILINFGKRIIP